MANVGVRIDPLARKRIRIETIVAECAVSRWCIDFAVMTYPNTLADSFIVVRAIAARITVALAMLFAGGGAAVRFWPHLILTRPARASETKQPEFIQLTKSYVCLLSASLKVHSRRRLSPIEVGTTVRLYLFCSPVVPVKAGASPADVLLSKEISWLVAARDSVFCCPGLAAMIIERQ
eukprot:XP_001707808.1 Hypothetical protein GL50803_29582 [Giardia lamblia ATCC 50803]